MKRSCRKVFRVDDRCTKCWHHRKAHIVVDRLLLWWTVDKVNMPSVVHQYTFHCVSHSSSPKVLVKLNLTALNCLMSCSPEQLWSIRIKALLMEVREKEPDTETQNLSMCDIKTFQEPWWHTVACFLSSGPNSHPLACFQHMQTEASSTHDLTW